MSKSQGGTCSILHFAAGAHVFECVHRVTFGRLRAYKVMSYYSVEVLLCHLSIIVRLTFQCTALRMLIT
jgi:hypothetical protein